MSSKRYGFMTLWAGWHRRNVMIIVCEWTVWKRRVLGFIWRFKSKESKRWESRYFFHEDGVIRNSCRTALLWRISGRKCMTKAYSWSVVGPRIYCRILSRTIPLPLLHSPPFQHPSQVPSFLLLSTYSARQGYISQLQLMQVHPPPCVKLFWKDAETLLPCNICGEGCEVRSARHCIRGVC